jgi:hypothetical protein
MSGILTVVAMLGSYAVVLGGLVWIAAKVRRSGSSAPLLGVMDQIYRPTAEEARGEIRIQDERAAPNPSGDDQDPRARLRLRLHRPGRADPGRGAGAARRTGNRVAPRHGGH